MIYKLRFQFIKICAVSLIAVLINIFAVLVILNNSQLNLSVDEITDLLGANDGTFPLLYSEKKLNSDYKYTEPGFITRESAFSTRFFTVSFDRRGQIIDTNTMFILSVSDDKASAYAKKAISGITKRGWISDYRYKIIDSPDDGKSVIFVDGSTNRELSRRFVFSSALVLVGSGAILIALVIIFSKRAVMPVAASYEKQNQFITDANHELKTPLTLILANLDIAESELGKNEWLEDIRSEGRRMNGLINRLVMLTRMDENNSNPDAELFDLSSAIYDIAGEFKYPAEDSGRSFSCDIAECVEYLGEEASIRQLMSILLDNALKYCDEGGDISVKLSTRRHPVIVVENSYADVGTIALDRLFDRFYRSDKARTFDGGYGVGLSIAKMIVEKHNGEIKAYKAGDERIGFRIILR